MPFNGLEFGNLILKERGLQNVMIEQTKIGDHYDLNEKKVRVLDERLNKKSITAISIVCHEIGHAIQHAENYKPLEQRNKIVKNTIRSLFGIKKTKSKEKGSIRLLHAPTLGGIKSKNKKKLI